ncbi:hypothetical protein [Curtobacterium sp. VKM Ac-2852]|uniref:hypothetical protein n=1 Tax=Curtobacterium sp. VKM Ac-2852 TaxID=2739024 RepID=UPI001566CE5D|nr:hypothetical protein [Curtobacterium sp. VKM Ac-2852]NQX24418.1 hypothetical protein [Curtobacterium sp. VKM Ac-2852]
MPPRAVAHAAGPRTRERQRHRRRFGAFHEGRHPSRSSILANAALLLVAAVLVGVVAYRTRLEVTNIDGISYMSIAEQYAGGHWAEAVNGYWSPMVSWLMAPFMVMGFGPSTAFAIVNLAASTAVMGVGAWLLLRTTGNGWTAAWSIVATAPLMLANVALQTPDTLVLLWGLLFVWSLLAADRAWHGSVRRIVVAAAVVGLVCAIGYCTKAFLVPVFLVVVPSWALVRWFQDRRDAREPRSLLLPVVALLTAVLFSAPWVGALSAKFGGIELGSSLTVNVSKKFSDSSGKDYQEVRIPSPPNGLAVSPNEDRTPSLYEAGVYTAERELPVRLPAGTPVAAEPDESSTTTLVGKVRYYVEQRLEALPFYFTRIGSFAPFALAIGVVFVGAAVAGVVHYRRFVFTSIVGLFSGVYLLGYAGIATVESLGGNARYYLPLFTGSVLVAGALLPTFWRTVRRGRRIRKVVAVLGCVLVVVASYSQNVNGVRAPFSTYEVRPSGIPAGQVLGEVIHPDEPLVDALLASDVIPAGSRILGTNTRNTVLVAFRLGAQMYGEDGQAYDYQDPAFVGLLREADVQYFLNYTNPRDPQVRDYSAIGPVVGTFPVYQVCSDAKGAPQQSCSVDVIQVAER